MPHLRTVIPPRTGGGPVASSEDDDLPLLRGDGFTTGLGARSLLDQQELTAGVIAVASAKKACKLEREHHLAVQILMQAVVASGFVGQEQRRRLCLSMFEAVGETPS